MRALVVLALLLLGSCVVAGAWMAEGALRPPKRPVDASDHEAAAGVARKFGGDLELVSVQASDGPTLRGWLLRSGLPNGDAALLLHGVSDSREGTLGVAALLLERGYAVLAPDARAHGESDGAIATYGVREAEDVRRWVDLLVERTRSRRYFGFGASMGGAILLQSLRVETRFAAVVAQSPFCDFREISCDYVSRRFGAGPWLGRTLLRPLLYLSRTYARVRYGVDLSQASPEAAIAATAIPVLLIHGAEDRNIPARHSRRLQRSNPARVSLWEIPGAGHDDVATRAGTEFGRRILDWFDSHGRP